MQSSRPAYCETGPSYLRRTSGLTPSDFQTLVDLKRNVMAFQARYQRAAKPFKWTFTRRDLHALLAKLKKRRAKARKLRQRNTSP